MKPEWIISNSNCEADIEVQHNSVLYYDIPKYLTATHLNMAD